MKLLKMNLGKEQQELDCYFSERIMALLPLYPIVTISNLKVQTPAGHPI